jgi:PAS domain S-box-containing protein
MCIVNGSLRLFIVVLAVILVSINPGWAQIKNKQPGPSKVIAVIPYDAPPTYFLDAKTGKAAGFAVDVMDKIAERAGLQVEYIFAHSWTEIISKVKRGEADLIPNMSLSDERQKRLAFTSPTETAPLSFFVRSHTGLIDVMKGSHTVGVILGSVAHERLSGNANLSLVTYDSFQQGLFDLLAGKIDAFACPAPILLRLARESGVEDKIKTAGAPIAELKRAIAVRKDNTQLLERLNTAVEGFVGGPEYRRIYTMWFGKPAPYWTAYRILTICAVLVFVLIGGMCVFRYITILRFSRSLRSEIEKRRQVEAELKKSHDELEQKVDERTFDLGIANEELEYEIGERMRAEETLQESEKRYHLLFDQSPDGILLIDTAGKILEFNETAHQQLGYSREEFAELSLADIDPVESPEEILGKIGKVLEAGKAELDVKHRTKQGEVRDVHIITQVMILSGSPVLYAIWHDITERQRTEKALLESEKFLQTIIDTEPACIKLLTEDGTLLQMNRAGLSMLEADSLQQVKGRCIYPLVAEEYRGAFKAVTEDVFKGKSGMLEFEAVGLKGRHIFLETHAVPLRNNRDEIIALLGITLDITERNKTEEQIKASLKEKEVLLREIHHRVKNNLNVIISLLNLQSRHITEPAMLNIFKDCQNRIRSMALIHERLYQTKDFAEINYKEYITSLISDLSSSYIHMKNKIRMVPVINDIFLDLDTAIPCGLIINELVTNSLKYAFPEDRSGEIIVSLIRDNSRYILSVRDNGIGLPEGFDLKSSETLGLHLVKILVKQLDGILKTSVDKGTEFRVTFSGKMTGPKGRQ